MQRRNGFTLIEITIAVVILVVALLIAVPSVTGVLADRRLRRSLLETQRGGGAAGSRFWLLFERFPGIRAALLPPKNRVPQ